jgi:hypothetical protein
MSPQRVVSSPEASCHIFTYKEGLLSSVAHDLKLVVENCSIQPASVPSAEPREPAIAAITATFDARSIRVVCAQRDGHDQPSALSADNRAEIERHIQRDVLHTDRFPEVRFVTTKVTANTDFYDIVGELTLHGQRRTIATQVRKQADRWVCEVRLNQPDFGIKPFSAAFGTLRVKPELLVHLSLPVT